jgi:hypothetical protein
MKHGESFHSFLGQFTRPGNIHSTTAVLDSHGVLPRRNEVMMQRLRAFVAEDLSEEDYAVPRRRCGRGEGRWTWLYG